LSFKLPNKKLKLMPKQFFLLLIGLAISFGGCKSKKMNKDGKVKIEVSVTQTKSYCGGASPTAEVLKQLNTPKPLADKTFIVRKGQENDLNEPIIAQFTTNELGVSSFRLPPGNYIITDIERADTKKFTQLMETYSEPTENYGKINVPCLSNWLKRPYIKFTVNEGEPLQLSFNIRQNCDWEAIPCVQFTGPLPPAAPPK
jgi:hypothetical protein